MKTDLRILVIDDDSSLLRIVADRIQQFIRAAVFTTASVPGALTLIEKQGPFDVIVSDYQLPPHTAQDLLQHLEGARTETPFIIYSGLLSLTDSQFSRPDFLGLIFKPATNEVITRLLDKFPKAAIL